MRIFGILKYSTVATRNRKAQILISISTIHYLHTRRYDLHRRIHVRLFVTHISFHSINWVVVTIFQNCTKTKDKRNCKNFVTNTFIRFCIACNGLRIIIALRKKNEIRRMLEIYESFAGGVAWLCGSASFSRYRLLIRTSPSARVQRSFDAFVSKS